MMLSPVDNTKPTGIHKLTDQWREPVLSDLNLCSPVNVLANRDELLL